MNNDAWGFCSFVITPHLVSDFQHHQWTINKTLGNHTGGATLLQMEALQKSPGINVNISTRGIPCLFSIFLNLAMLHVSD